MIFPGLPVSQGTQDGLEVLGERTLDLDLPGSFWSRQDEH